MPYVCTKAVCNHTFSKIKSSNLPYPLPEEDKTSLNLLIIDESVRISDPRLIIGTGMPHLESSDIFKSALEFIFPRTKSKISFLGEPRNFILSSSFRIVDWSNGTETESS